MIAAWRPHALALATRAAARYSRSTTGSRVHASYHGPLRIGVSTRRASTGHKEDKLGGSPLPTEAADVPVLSIVDSKWAEAPFSMRVFATLGLSDFSEEDLHSAFTRVNRNKDGMLTRGELRTLVSDIHGDRLTGTEIDQFTDRLWEYQTKGLDLPQESLPIGGAPASRASEPDLTGGSAPCKSSGGGVGITEAQFMERIRALALELDPRVMKIGAMFLASGISIGVVIPAMPQLVAALDISSSQYGVVVGAFAGAKMLGNMPAAALVDRFGRRNTLTASMAVIGVSFVGIAAALNFESIAMCRALTGVGVAGFMSAATMYLTDISNSLNRAKSLAPPMTAFSAGTAVGPAVGGVLADMVGIPGTFAAVGASFAALAVANHAVLPEPTPLGALVPSRGPADGAEGTKNRAHVESIGSRGDTIAAEDGRGVGAKSTTDSESAGVLSQWRSLLKDPRMRHMTILAGAHWFVLSGSQMTLMPLMLVGDPFHLSASAIGAVFAASSVLSVVFTPVAAMVLDSRVGKVRSIVPACAVIGGSMAAVPLCGDEVASFLALFGVWTTAGTVLAAGPTAYISNISQDKTRSQALALLRTGTDVGMLCGALTSGMVASVLSQPQTIMVNGMCILAVSALSGGRLWALSRGASMR